MKAFSAPELDQSQAVRSPATASPAAQMQRQPAADNSIHHLQLTADASQQTQQLRQLQAIADAGVSQLAGMDEEEPLQGAGMEDEELLQGAGMEEEDLLQGAGMDEEEPLQGKFAATGTVQREEAPAPNNTGMPDNLKSGIESLSGIDMSGVRVHQNSAEPAKVGAHAFAQGTDIHLASGQEQHLPHEAWHVVQQAQGRVQPTRQAKGIAINDDAGLEHEADVMGAMAMQQKAGSATEHPDKT